MLKNHTIHKLSLLHFCFIFLLNLVEVCVEICGNKVNLIYFVLLLQYSAEFCCWTNSKLLYETVQLSSTRGGKTPMGTHITGPCSSNDTGSLNQPISCDCLNHGNNSLHFGHDHTPVIPLYFRVECIHQSVSLFLFLSSILGPLHIPLYAHTHTPAIPPRLVCTGQCVFHLILFNEAHFTVRSLMMLIN